MDQKSLSYEKIKNEDGTYLLVITIPNLSESQCDSMTKGIDMAIRLALRKVGK